MKIVPIATGGLALELASADEWSMLTGILRDAKAPGFDLIEKVGAKMADDESWDDWAEFVLPDLRAGFEHHLQTVLKAIETARFDAAGGAGSVLIPDAEMFDWYAALNQARLALEARYQLSEGLVTDAMGSVPIECRAAYYRSQFYGSVQTYLLEYGLK